MDMQDQVGREPHTGPCQHSSTQLKATSGRGGSNRRPKVAAIRSSLNASSTILDGEMLVIGKDGRLSFNLVQRRCPTEHPTMFDALEALPIIGTDTVGMPYLGRQALLTRILEPEDHWKTPAHHVGHTANWIRTELVIVIKLAKSTNEEHVRRADFIELAS